MRKVAGKMASEATEFAADVVSNQGDLKSATMDYVDSKVQGKVLDKVGLKPQVATSNNKVVKSEVMNAAKEGRTLSAKEKQQVRADNKQRNSNLNNANKTRESIRTGLEYGIGYAKGTYDNYQEKKEKR